MKPPGGSSTIIPITPPTIRRTASASVTDGDPGTATAIPGTGMAGIPTTGGSIPIHSDSPATTADITLTGEGLATMGGEETPRGDSEWRERQADPGAAMLRRREVERILRVRPGVLWGRGGQL
jgi:hypothetical protein